MPDITPQTIIAAVSYHLLCQNERSTGVHGYCRYLSDTGNKCAVGVLIPPELYCEEMEGWGISHEPMASVLETAGLAEHQLLLKQLQRIHDGGYPAIWPRQLHELAIEYECDFII